jgi:PAS domain S-box-containing protein
MLGYGTDELKRGEVHLTDLVHPDDLQETRERLRKHLENKVELFEIEHRLRIKSGEWRWVHTRGKFVMENENETARITGTFTDITERKRLEEQLRQAQKMEAVGHLAGGLAHDFNNMLSAILGHSEIAMIRCTDGDPAYSHLKGIQAAALRSSDLIKQLLAFARKQTIAPTVLDINHMSSAILNMLRRVIGEDIDLSWLPGPDLWKIKIDPSQIDQLLINLCVNARDAITGVGKITIETHNVSFTKEYCGQHRGFVPGEYVMLAVSDNGCGMSKEIQGHIFEPFFTTKEMGKGTGLGLATVYGIVKQNNGFINLYSEIGKGTTFKIYFPRIMSYEKMRPVEPVSGIPVGHGEVVLLVEDEPAIREVTQAMLAELGYAVYSAGTPEEAIGIVNAHGDEIEMLITDVIMPKMNGRELAESIRAVKPAVACLFTSGYTANVIAHHGVLDKDVCFLAKPFSMQELAVKVKQAFRQKT